MRWPLRRAIACFAHQIAPCLDAQQLAQPPPSPLTSPPLPAPQSLVIPVDVEIFLIGFDASGGYAHQQDAGALSGLLSSGLNRHCPHSLESNEELGVCFQVRSAHCMHCMHAYTHACIA